MRHLTVAAILSRHDAGRHRPAPHGTGLNLKCPACAKAAAVTFGMISAEHVAANHVHHAFLFAREAATWGRLALAGGVR